MPEQNFWTLGTTAKYVSASPEQPVTIHNGGASTIGRNSTSAVVSTDNSLTSGQSVTIETGAWFISAASSHIIESRADAPASPGSFRGRDLYTFSGSPVSGTSAYATGVGQVDNGGLALDNTSGNLYVNEGTLASPYWTPASYDQPGLFSAYLRNSVGAGVPLAGTDAEAYVGNGVRVFGQGLEVADDAGFIGGTGVEGAEFNVMHVTNEVSHLTALGTQAGIYQPDTHGTLAVDVTFCDNADILTSSVFCGFIGTAASALDPVVTGATTVATFAIDDLAGLYSDSSMTDANGTYGVAEKSNEAGTQVGCTSIVDRAAAGTYQRWRVEVTTDGTAICFANKAQIGVISGPNGTANEHSATETALDADEEVSPVFYIENATTTTRTANIKQFSTWATIN